MRDDITTITARYTMQVHDVEHITGRSGTTVRRWIQAGLLDAVRVGPRQYRIDPASLDRLVTRA